MYSKLQNTVTHDSTHHTSVVEPIDTAAISQAILEDLHGMEQLPVPVHVRINRTKVEHTQAHMTRHDTHTSDREGEGETNGGLRRKEHTLTLMHPLDESG